MKKKILCLLCMVLIAMGGCGGSAAQQEEKELSKSVPNEEITEESVEETNTDDAGRATIQIYSPVSGVVVKVNGELADHPELVNQDPYGTWMIEVSEVQEHEEFMDSETYEAYLETDEAKA